MHLLHADSIEEAVQAAHQWVETRLADPSLRSVFLPAGKTPVPLYQFWEKTKPAFLSGRTLLQVDDVAQGEKRGLFREFFEEALPTWTSQFRWIEGMPFIREGTDLRSAITILGLGTNGHIAFHEPGLAPLFDAGEVVLSSETCSNLGLPPLTRGLTYGAGTFLQTRSILIMAFGESKRAAIERMKSSDPTPDFPATLLKKHPDLTLLTSGKR